VSGGSAPGLSAPRRAPSRSQPWSSDEWDVTLADGTAYRISQAHSAEREPSRDQQMKDAWFVDGILD
jgi:hypothetical protein